MVSDAGGKVKLIFTLTLQTHTGYAADLLTITFQRSHFLLSCPLRRLGPFPLLSTKNSAGSTLVLRSLSVRLSNPLLRQKGFLGVRLSTFPSEAGELGENHILLHFMSQKRLISFPQMTVMK